MISLGVTIALILLSTALALALGITAGVRMLVGDLQDDRGAPPHSG